MGKGILITKNSQSVKSANPEEFYVNSKTPLFKLFKSGSGVQKMAGVFGETHDIIIPHNLGYIPFFLIFMDRTPGTDRQLVTNSQQSQTNINVQIAASLGQSNPYNLILSTAPFNNPPQAGDYGYNYFIYYDRLSGSNV